VAGVTALYLEGHPNATADEVDQALTTNATTGKITWNNPFGQKKPGQGNFLLYTGFITGTPPAPPAAPSNLTATAVSFSQINLAWSDNSDNESGFKIERCEGAGCTNFAQVATAGQNATSYQDTGLSGSTTYRYQVRASNSGGNSDYSNIAEATTPAPPSPPAAPSNLTATAVSNSQINLAWTDNAGNEDGFKIERCQGAGCVNFAQIASVGANVTSYQNTGLAVGTTYRYRVRASNGGGNSDYSNTAAATTFDNPPVAKYTWACSAKGGRVCNFNGTSSTDDKGITSYSWNFGDGTTGTGGTVTKTYDSRGSYTVTLTVSDGVNPGQSCAKSVQTGTSGACP
jgi:PKD repeat protein